MESSQPKFKFGSPYMIKPAAATLSTHPENLKLTQFDKNYAIYFPAMFLYRLENSVRVFDSMVAQLKSSLAQVLEPFYPMAGRMVKSESDSEAQILCNDEGVPFVEAQVEEKMDDVLFAGGEYQTVPQLSGLEALGLQIRANVDWPGVPALIVQVTRFSCGAMALGVTWHHSCADGVAFMQFMTSWCEIAISGHTSIVPDHSRAAVFSRLELTKPQGLSTQVSQESKSGEVSTDLKSDLDLESRMTSKNVSTKPLPTDGTTSTTEMTEKKSRPDQTQTVQPKVQSKVYKLKTSWIEELQRATNASSGSLPGEPGFRLTKVDCITAHIWRCISRALVAKRKLSRSSVWTSVEGRSRLLCPPLSQHYFGNVLAMVWLGTSSTSDLENSPPSFAAQLIHKAVRNIKPEDCWATMLQRDELIRHVKMGKDDFAGIVAFSSWMRFPMYDMDYGYGKPFWAATNVTMETGNIAVLLPTPPGKSFVPVQLYLLEDIWDAILSDPEFLEAEDKLATFI